MLSRCSLKASIRACFCAFADVGLAGAIETRYVWVIVQSVARSIGIVVSCPLITLCHEETRLTFVMFDASNMVFISPPSCLPSGRYDHGPGVIFTYRFVTPDTQRVIMIAAEYQNARDATPGIFAPLSTSGGAGN